MHSGYFPIVPGSESLFMSSSCHSLFNVIKYAMGRYYNYKISGSHQKILQEIMKKYFFGSNRVRTGDLEVIWRILNESQENRFKTAFLLKMFALLTSQSAELEKKQPKFLCGNLIISKDGQKWPSKTIFPTLFYLNQRFATSI